MLMNTIILIVNIFIHLSRHYLKTTDGRCLDNEEGLYIASSIISHCGNGKLSHPTQTGDSSRWNVNSSFAGLHTIHHHFKLCLCVIDVCATHLPHLIGHSFNNSQGGVYSAHM